MIEKICTHFVDRGIVAGFLTASKHDIYVYACDLLLSSLVTKLAVIILALILGHLPGALLYFIATIPLRQYGGGWHAPKHYMCTAIQCASFSIVALIVELLSADMLLIISACACILLFLLSISVVPIDNPNNPYILSVRRKCRVICAIWTILVSMSCISFQLLGHAYVGSMIGVSTVPVVISFVASIILRKGGVRENEEGINRQGT